MSAPAAPASPRGRPLVLGQLLLQGLHASAKGLPVQRAQDLLVLLERRRLSSSQSVHEGCPVPCPATPCGGYPSRPLLALALALVLRRSVLFRRVLFPPLDLLADLAEQVQRSSRRQLVLLNQLAHLIRRAPLRNLPPEGLVDLRDVRDHGQLVRNRAVHHLLTSHHGRDAVLPLQDVERPLVVCSDVVSRKLVEVDEVGTIPVQDGAQCKAVLPGGSHVLYLDSTVQRHLPLTPGQQGVRVDDRLSPPPLLLHLGEGAWPRRRQADLRVGATQGAHLGGQHSLQVQVWVARARVQAVLPQVLAQVLGRCLRQQPVDGLPLR
uniref:Putative secreted protein n=1 Tax=Ixodes ricinus TaxID=34613 RepID=A0A147BE45_IXORI